ncbi:MAG: sulfotransferase, partial [Flavobacteriaceae bacterium]
PSVYSGPETHFFISTRSLFQHFERAQSWKVGLNAYMTRDEFHGMIREMFKFTISRLPKPETKPVIFLEKTPTHAGYSSQILRIFPNAQFIHLIRDPRAVIASLRRISKTWAKRWAPEKVTSGAQIWISNVSMACEIPKFVKSPLTQYMELKYEDLRKDPESHLENLWSWMGIDANDELLKKTVQANSMSRANSSSEIFSSIQSAPANDVATKDEVVIPTDFIGKAAVKLSDYNLSELEIARIDQLAGELMVRLGYERAFEKLSIRRRLMVSTTFRKIIGLEEI